MLARYRRFVAVSALATLLSMAGAISSPLASGASSAAGLSPPYTTCPAIGSSPSCGILLVVNSDHSISVLGDSSVPPFDGSEDTLVGIQNNSATPVPAITVSGPVDLASFDGDGLCSFPVSGCPFGPTSYEGPGTSFTTQPGDTQDVEVDFANGGLAAGGSTYFSLEGALTSAVLTARPGTLCTPTSNLLGNPGFEAPIASKAPAPGNWVVSQSAPPTISQPSNPVHSGSASLAIRTTKSSGVGYVSQQVSGFQPTNGWTFSAYFYAASGLTQFITVANADPASGVNDSIRVFLPTDGGPELATSAGGFVADKAAPITLHHWHLISLAATTSTIQMSLDGGSAVSLPYTPPVLTQGGVTTISFGLPTATFAGDFFFDDTALVQTCSGAVAPGVTFSASDKDWTVTAQVTPHNGMEVTDLATNSFARDLGATISMPYVTVTRSRQPTSQIYFLLRNGDEIDSQGHVYGHSQLIAGPNIVKRHDTPGGFELQATYLITLDPPSVANPSMLKVQERIILVDTIDESDHGVVPCEPSQTSAPISGDPLICDRFRPVLSYTFLPGPGDQLIRVDAVERLHFHPDSKPIAASTLIHDCNAGETISENGDPCFNAIINGQKIDLPGPGIALYNDQNPLQTEVGTIAVDQLPEANLGGGPGNFPGFVDNVHLTTHSMVGLPIPIPPGCPECIHMHWRWGSDISGPNLGNGDPLVGCCDKLWPTADKNNLQNVEVFLVSNKGANDKSLQAGMVAPTFFNIPPGIPLNDPVIWFAASSPQTSNSFFAWGGFVCPSPDGQKLC